MAYCSNCGNKLEDGAAFCNVCGAKDGNAEYKPAVRTDFTADMDVQDIEDNRFLAAASYLGVIFIVLAMIVKPDSKFVRFHANQSLVLNITSILIGIACAIPLAGLVVAVVSPLLLLFVLILQVIGAINAFQRKAKQVPVVGQIKII